MTPVPAPAWRKGFPLALALVTLWVAILVAPIFFHPQLDADDYRYFDLVRQLRAGEIGWLRACIIENRWDHLWWVDTEQVVRFFRPTLLTSYLLDDLLHGHSLAGLFATNALLYWASCALTTWLAFRLITNQLAATLASLLYASFAAHAETIWYVAGRNETLAAVGFLAAFALHLQRGRLRLLALPCYAFALLSKELTLPLPLLLLLHDRYLSGDATALRDVVKRSATLWIGYAAVALAYLAVRTTVLAAHGGSAMVYPYFVSPDHADFAGHLLRQLRSYAENLGFGAVTPPFLRGDQAPDYLAGWRTALACAAAAAALVALRRDARMWFGLGLAFVTWLPTSVVYVSERYLTLPSFGVALIAGALLTRTRQRELRWALLGILLVWIGTQAWMLRRKNKEILARPQSSLVLTEHLAKLRPQVDPHKPVLFANFPFDVFAAQFLEPLLREAWQTPEASCRVASLLPDPEDLRLVGGTAVRRVDAQSFDVTSTAALMLRSRWPFPFVELVQGTKVQRDRVGFGIELTAAKAGVVSALRVSLPKPIDSYTVLRFTPPAGFQFDSFGAYVRAGRIDVIKP